MKTFCFSALGRSMSGCDFLHLLVPREKPKVTSRSNFHGIHGLFLSLIFFMCAFDIFSQCTPNTIVFLGSQPIFNTACGNNSYQTIDGSVPLPNNGNQTFQWEYSLNGNPYVFISSTGVDLPKNDITDLILLPNGNATGNYAIRRTVHDNSPVCSTISSPVFLYYAQNSSQTAGGSITPNNTSACFSADGTLTLQGHTGPIHRWEVSFNDGAWTIISNITNQYTYDLNTDGTSCYRALIDDVCSGAVGTIDLGFDDYSGEACVEVIVDPPSITSCAISRNLSGCEAAMITSPPYSAMIATSSVSAFVAAPNHGIVSSNCGVSMVTYIDMIINESCPVQVNRTWTISDVVGNTSFCSQLITVADATPPVITTSASNQNVECDGVGNSAVFEDWLAMNGGAAAVDACSEVSWSNDFASFTDLCGTTANATVHFTATDLCGNRSTTTATFAIMDSTDPMITTSASNLIVECDGAGNSIALSGFLNSRGGAVAIDVCSEITWSNDFSGFNDLCGLTGLSEVHFTATDACGNKSTSTASFTIMDTTEPQMTTGAEDMTVECDGNGNLNDIQLYLNSSGGAVSNDICGSMSWTNDFSHLSDACGATGNAIIHFTATDGCGNASTTSATFSIEDSSDPLISTLASNLTVECDGAGNISERSIFINSNGGAIATDICSVVSWSNDFSALSDLCGATGIKTIHFTATDQCGNASTTTAVFTIVDLTNPLISTDAVNATVESDGAGNVNQLQAFLNTRGGAQVSDVCGSVMWSNDFNQLSDLCGATGSATIHFTATDDCGNASTTTAIFTIIDTTDPLIIQPAQNMIVQCDGSGNTNSLDTFLNTKGGAMASDVNSSVTWTNNFSSLSDLCGATGSASVQFTAIDVCGNASTTTATFTIEDTVTPVISPLASNLTVECDGSGNQGELGTFLNTKGGAEANDICSGVTWTNDYNGFSDLCGATGSSTIRFTATDGCGNASTTTAVMTITDSVKPVISTSAVSVVVECNGTGNTMQLATFLDTKGGAVATDACSNVSWSNDFVSLSDLCGATGSSTVHFTATDACGNARTTTASFTIVDTTKPIITSSAVSVTVECNGTGNTSELTTFLNTRGGANATDQCSGVTWTNDYSGLSDLCGATGSATVHFTATDACGNVKISTATFTIMDSSSPVINTPASNSTVQCAPNNAATLTSWLNNRGGAIATDVCGGVSWSYTPNPAVLSDLCGATGSVTVQFKATDNCGNFSITTATFTVVDLLPPVISPGASNMTVQCNGTGNSSQLSSWLSSRGGASSSDACSGVVWTNDFVSLSDLCGATGSSTVRFTATDACGNARTTTASFTIVDVTGPAINLGAGPTSFVCPGIPSFPIVTITDQCDPSPILTFSDITTAGTCVQEYSITRTWIATDVCNNSSIASRTVQVVDSSPPAITCPASLSISKDDQCEYNAHPSVTGYATASDNCDSNPTVSFTDESCFSNNNTVSMNHGQGYYFPVTITGYGDLNASQLHKLELEFYSNHGKGNVEFILIAPSGDGIVLVGPYCSGGFCEVDDGTIYNPSFHPNTSGFTKWENDNFIAPGPGNFKPYGGTSPNSIVGFNGNFKTRFENLTGPMNGEWILFGRKDGTSTGTILFSGFCITPASCIDDELIVRTWIATDACGNASPPCRQAISIKDTSPPEITGLPAPSTIECFMTPVFASPSVSDACDPEPSYAFNEVTIPGECQYEYSVTRTWTANDQCNNSSVSSQTITVVCEQVPNSGTVSGETPVCIGTTTAYSSNGDPGGQWTSTNLTVASVHPSSGLVTALTAGTTDITYTVGSPCNGTSSAFKILTVQTSGVTNLNDSGIGSLRDVTACAEEGSVITFHNSLVGGTIVLTSGEIPINRNLTITGLGMTNLTLSGNNASRIFRIYPGYELHLEEIALKNSTSLSNGGAIYVEGDLFLENVLFQFNYENGILKALTASGSSTVEIIGNVNLKN